MKIDIKHLKFGRGTVILLTSLVNNKYTSNLFLLQECFAKGYSCAITQITGDAAGHSKLIPKDAVQFQGCGVCITAAEIKEAITSLYEPWECKHIKKLANRIELKHIQYCFPFQSEATTYGIGTIFTLTSHCEDGQTETEAFMLKDSDDEDFELQILQVSGKYSGWSPGYIHCKALTQRLTQDELWEGIKFNFYQPEKDSLLVYSEKQVYTYGEHLVQVVQSLI